MAAQIDGPEVMTPAEVARIFRVDRGTVSRWARSGRLESFRTPGGHRRFRRDVVQALLRDRPPAGEAAGSQ